MGKGIFGPALLGLGRLAELPPSSRGCGTSEDISKGWWGVGENFEKRKAESEKRGYLGREGGGQFF